MMIILTNHVFVLEPPLVSKWNEGSDSSAPGGFKTFNKNDNDKNSNANNYKGFGSQSAGNFRRNNCQFDS